MNPFDHGILIIDLGPQYKALRTELAMLSLMHCPVIVIEEPAAPTRLEMEETVMHFNCSIEADTPFFPRETAWERANPNAPWYRRFKKPSRR
jgi:hypothetical protein